MADPQVENGYTRIANELLTALAKYPFSGSEFMIMLAIISKTYGYNKTSDTISIGQLATLTGLSKRGVCKATLSLVNKKALGREQNGTTYITTYWIQKDYDKWIIASEQNGTNEQNGTRASAKTGIQLVNKMAPTKDNIQKTIQDIPAQAVVGPPAPPKIKHLTYVLLLPVEYEKLVARFGQEETDQMIYRLNNYIGSTGKRYKSHYHTILSWADMDSRKK